MKGTIRNQYLNRWGIGSAKQLSKRLQQAVKAYNKTRPHQSIGKMPSLAYEKLLPFIPETKREIMTIYTVSKYKDNFNTTQPNLFQQLA